MSSKSAVSEFFCNDLSGSQRVRMDAEQCGWHILLLEAAWRGNPPCSLPDDDHYLQRLVGAEPPKLLSVNPESLSKHVCDVYRSKVNQLMTAMGVSQDCSKSVFAILETMMLDAVRSATDEQARKLQSLSDESHRRRWQEVSNCFVKRNGLLVDPRLKEEYDKQEYRRQQKAAAGVKGNAEMRKRYYLQPSDDLTEFSDLPNQHPQDDQTASRQRPGLSNSSSTSSSAYISPSLVKGT